jgi:Predicted acetyltransferase
MIERLLFDEGGEALAYLKREPALNTFIIGDYLNCGLSGREDVKFYVSRKNGEINGLMMLFRKWFHFSFPYNGDEEETKRFVASLGIGNLKLNGPENAFDLVSAKTKHPCHLVSIRKSEWDFRKGRMKAELLASDKARDVCNLYGRIDEFENNAVDAETQIANQKLDMERGESAVFGIYDNGILVSAVGLAAINPVSAMVIGVCTLPEYRRRGYASSTLYSMLDYVFGTLKLECVSLFWNNGVAGKMYADAGFSDVGEYLMGALD